MIGCQDYFLAVQNQRHHQPSRLLFSAGLCSVGAKKEEDAILRSLIGLAMNELLAIIAIVLVCCAMFFAWLFSMATCPDRMVNLISGSNSSHHGSSSNGSSSASKELINAKYTDSPSPDNSSSATSKTSSRASSTVSNFLSRLNSQRSATSKKLSVVPEADEQLTVTSIKEPKGTEEEDRCVEDVIDRRRRQLLEQQGGDWMDGQPMTADVTPVPSRCPSRQGLNSVVDEEEVLLSNGHSAPAIVQSL
uniref:Uncharacterized protein n=1 Tax=Ditylenchus dipsaci TaxID=166011 RepID=A0A915E669_9BILA